jgi:hypothetical protein
MLICQYPIVVNCGVAKHVYRLYIACFSPSNASLWLSSRVYLPTTLPDKIVPATPTFAVDQNTWAGPKNDSCATVATTPPGTGDCSFNLWGPRVQFPISIRELSAGQSRPPR